MSHLSETVALYRHDPFVTHEQYVKLCDDAFERDLADTLRAEAPEPEQDATLAFPDRQVAPTSAAALWQRNTEAALAAARGDDAPMTPEQAAAYLLEQHEKVVSAIEWIGKAIEGLSELDDKRAADLEALTDAVEFLGRRVDLRGEECTALGLRLDNLHRFVQARTAEGGA
jgi:hypothetical protein